MAFGNFFFEYFLHLTIQGNFSIKNVFLKNFISLLFVFSRWGTVEQDNILPII